MPFNLFARKRYNFMEFEQALEVLHVDAGANDALIESLLAALPDYIEVTT